MGPVREGRTDLVSSHRSTAGLLPYSSTPKERIPHGEAQERLWLIAPGVKPLKSGGTPGRGVPSGLHGNGMSPHQAAGPTKPIPVPKQGADCRSHFPNDQSSSLPLQ